MKMPNVRWHYLMVSEIDGDNGGRRGIEVEPDCGRSRVMVCRGELPFFRYGVSIFQGWNVLSTRAGIDNIDVCIRAPEIARTKNTSMVMHMA